MIKLTIPLFLLPLALFAQNQTAAAPQTAAQPPEQPSDRYEVSVAYFGSFPSAADGNDVHQGATASWGVLGDARYFFTPHHGVEINYAYNRDTQQFLQLNTAYAVHTNVSEATASYVWHSTVSIATPFLSAGGGALVFDPLTSGTFTPTPATTQARAAFVYAAGLDLALTQHLSIRQEYRAFVLRAPTFGTGVGSEGGVYISEAVLGFNWKL